MSHAIRAAFVLATPVRIPVSGLDQLLVGTGVPIGHEVAGSLPTEHGVARDAPGRALEVGLALEEVKEEGRVIQPPLLPVLLPEGVRKQLLRLLDTEEVLLIGC